MCGCLMNSGVTSWEWSKSKHFYNDKPETLHIPLNGDWNALDGGVYGSMYICVLIKEVAWLLSCQGNIGSAFGSKDFSSKAYKAVSWNWGFLLVGVFITRALLLWSIFGPLILVSSCLHGD